MRADDNILLSNPQLERLYGRNMERYGAWLERIAMRRLRKALDRTRSSDALPEDDEPIPLEEATAAVSAALGDLLAAPVDPDQGAPPLPPDVQVAANGRAVMVRRAQVEVRRLIEIGYPADQLAQALGVNPDDLFSLTDVTPEQLALLESWVAGGRAGLIASRERARSSLISRLIAALRGDRVTAAKLTEAVRKTAPQAFRAGRQLADGQDVSIQEQVRRRAQGRAGITHYIWRTRNDSRVRPSHRRAEDQIVAWDSSGYPGTGNNGGRAHPGEAYGCRCDADPILPERLGVQNTDVDVPIPAIDLNLLRSPEGRDQARRALEETGRIPTGR